MSIGFEKLKKGLELEDFSLISSEQNGTSGNCEIGYTSITNSPRSAALNLGIYRDKKGYHTGRFCGTTWLKDKSGNIVTDDNGVPQTITVKPRFGLDLNEMVQKIAEDEEFFDYLCSDLPEGERMFSFFFKENMIAAQKDEFGANRIIAVLTFIHELYQITGRRLMKKIVRREDNFVGKIKGKIVFNKQISKNIIRGHEERVYCGYVEKSEDIWENRILKYALSQATEYLNSGGNKFRNSLIDSEIRACRLRLNNVSDLEFVDADELDCLQVPAMYADYENLFILAQIVIAEVSLNAKQENCSDKIVPYAVNMPLLFECYARTLIKEAIGEKQYCGLKMLKFVPDKSKEYDENEYGIRTIPGNYYISGKLVPDIVLVKGDDKYIVLDVKYKKMEWNKNDELNVDNNARREDRLQLLAYNEMYRSELCGHVFPGLYKEGKGQCHVDYFAKKLMPNTDIYYYMAYTSQANEHLKNTIIHISKQIG